MSQLGMRQSLSTHILLRNWRPRCRLETQVLCSRAKQQARRPLSKRMRAPRLRLRSRLVAQSPWSRTRQLVQWPVSGHMQAPHRWMRSGLVAQMPCRCFRQQTLRMRMWAALWGAHSRLVAEGPVMEG